MASNDTFLSKKDDRTRINPAESDKQVGLADNITANSDTGGIEVLTITSNVANGADQVCRSAIIWTDGSDVTVKIGTGAADANDFLMLTSVYLPVPVSNTSLLRFYGGSNGKKVYILYRS